MQLHKFSIGALAIFVSVMFSACTEEFFNKTIELDTSDYEKQMSMYCFYSNEDTTFRVSVGQNRALTETVKEDDYWLPNAQVQWIDAAGGITRSPNYGNTSFFYIPGPDLPTITPGNTYTLTASAAGLPSIKSTQVMPSAIAIDTVIYIEDAGVSQFGEDVSRAEVRFQDPAGIKNYYTMQIWRKSYYYNTVTDGQGNIIRIDTLSFTNQYWPEEPRDPAALDGISGEIVVSDALFDGQLYQLRFSFIDYSGNQGNNDEVLTIRFKHITEDEYLYRISEAKRQASENFPLVEPAIVHGNIQDGIGIFCLSWSKTVEAK